MDKLVARWNAGYVTPYSKLSSQPSYVAWEDYERMTRERDLFRSEVNRIRGRLAASLSINELTRAADSASEERK